MRVARRSSSFAGATLVAVGLALPAGSPAMAPPWPKDPQGPRFGVEVDVITVDAVVLDGDGQPVEGLVSDDFTLQVDGVRRTIDRFEAASPPESVSEAPPVRTRVSANVGTGTASPARSFVVVFDDVHLAPDRALAAKAAVESFVEGLRDGDELTLVPTSGGAGWTARMPEGRADVPAALDRLRGERPRNTALDRISDYEAMRLVLARDPQVGAEVVRRYYEHRIILEPPRDRENPENRDLLEMGEGHPLIRAKALEVWEAALARKKRTLEVLERVATSLAGARGRKAIVLVSEGFVQEPDPTELAGLLDAARRANAAVYFLDARGLSGLPATADAEIADPTDLRDMGSQLGESLREAQGAVSLAVDTGGFAIRNANDLGRGLHRIDEESRHYYLLGFAPPGGAAEGTFHEIEVGVSRPGARVLARKGYFTPSREAPAATDDSRLRALFDSPFEGDGIPIRMTSYVRSGGADQAAAASVLLVAEVDPAALGLVPRDDHVEGVLETHLVVVGRDTGQSVERDSEAEVSLPAEAVEEARSTWLPLRREIELAPGTYQARLLVRDRATQRVGSVRHEFEVPPPGELRISTPVLTDQLQAGEPGGVPQPRPVVRRRFAPGTLYYAYEVDGAEVGPAGARVVAGWRVETTDGTVLATRPEAPLEPGPGGRLAQASSLDLATAPAGEYALLLTVRDEVAGRTLESREIFRLGEAGEPGRPTTRAAEVSPPAGIPLRASAYVFEQDAEGRARVLLVSEADPASLTFWNVADHREARVEIDIAVTPTGGGEPVRLRTAATIRPDREQGPPLEVGWARALATVHLPPGAHEARIEVTDKGSSRRGSVVTRVEVPSPGGLRACRPILTDTFLSAPAGQVGPPIPLARERFDPDTQLGVFFEVYGVPTGTPVEVACRMLREDGQALASLPHQPLPPAPDGTLGTMIMLPLKGVPEGHYELVLDFREGKGGRSAEVREPFEVGGLVQAAAVTGGSGPAAAAGPRRSYADLATESLTGDPASAMTQALGWSDAAIADAAGELQRDASACDASCRRAAVLLHTEVAAVAARRGDIAASRRHEVAARALLDDPLVAKAPGAREFRQGWLVALGHGRRARSQLSQSLELYGQALGLGDDAEALLGTGSVHEALAFSVDLEKMAGPDGARLDLLQQTALQSSAAKEAEDAYRKALRVDPTLDEAHLRLGRVLALRGRRKDGRKELLAAALSADAYVAMLANVLLGKDLMGEGRTQAALERLRAAAAGPSSGRVHLALSYGLLRAGRAREARESLEAALSPPTQELDPWLGYHLGPHRGRGLETLTAALRDEIRSAGAPQAARASDGKEVRR